MPINTTYMLRRQQKRSLIEHGDIITQNDIHEQASAVMYLYRS